MGQQKLRKKLFKMFAYLSIAFFLVINFGHWITYKPLISRMDRAYANEWVDQPVEFITYIQHNARLQEILMLKLEGPFEGIPLISRSEANLNDLISLYQNQKPCVANKIANSFDLNFECGNQRQLLQLQDLSTHAWIGGWKYAFFASLFILFIGFITSFKMSDERLLQIWD